MAIEEGKFSGRIYQVQDFNSASIFLSNITEAVILTNPYGSTRYYGVRVIYNMLHKLQAAFPDKVLAIKIDVEDDYAGYCFLSRMQR
jgi:hypothetical protein